MNPLDTVFDKPMTLDEAQNLGFADKSFEDSERDYYSQQMKKAEDLLKTNYTHILEECAAVGRDRMEKYNNPVISMPIACDILEKTFGLKLSVEQICYVLVALKFSRQFKSFSEDSVKDIINYLAISLDARRKGV